MYIPFWCAHLEAFCRWSPAEAQRTWSPSANCAHCAAEAHIALFGPFTPVDRANLGFTLYIACPSHQHVTIVMEALTEKKPKYLVRVLG